MTTAPIRRDKHHTGDEPAEFIETPTFAPSEFPHGEADELGDGRGEMRAPWR